MQPSLTDNIMPTGAWAFDDSVAACFEDMLQRSIPQYAVMRELVFHLGCHFLHASGHIVDLGCSRGDALVPFVTKYGAACTYTGVEISTPMLEVARQRFAPFLHTDLYGNTHHVPLTIAALDLCDTYPDAMASLTLSILTLMFIPLEHRQQVLANVYQHTRKGGAFILVEKVLGQGAVVESLLTEEYYTLKRHNGYTNEAIQRKRLSLRGVLVPMTAIWNEDLLRNAGFSHVECFWRWCNFAGWLALKN